MDFIYELPSNPWFYLFISALTIGGFVLAYKSTPQKVLKYEIVNNELINCGKPSLSKLKILYGETPINRLTNTRIAVWNDSFPTINNTDLIESAPLSIVVTDGCILDYSAFCGSESSNKIELERSDDNHVKISFDYLDHKEGCFINIIHTGNENSLELSKKIKGGKVAKHNNMHSAVTTTTIGTLVILFLTLAFLLNEELFQPLRSLSGSPQNAILIVIFFALSCTTIYSLLVIRITLYPYIPQNCRTDIKQQLNKKHI